MSKSFLALATDYDGTLANLGQIKPSTLFALKKLKSTGRKILLVTGRILEDLQIVFPEFNIIDWIVAENGAHIYCPKTEETTYLGSPLPLQFREILVKKNIPTTTLGHIILSTTAPYEEHINNLLEEHGIKLEKIKNKDAIMFLPKGVHKLSGLSLVLQKLSLDFDHLVGVGDAENDLIFLKKCGYSAAVANALPAIQIATHWTSPSPEGDGVTELIENIIQNQIPNSI